MVPQRRVKRFGLYDGAVKLGCQKLLVAELELAGVGGCQGPPDIHGLEQGIFAVNVAHALHELLFDQGGIGVAQRGQGGLGLGQRGQQRGLVAAVLAQRGQNLVEGRQQGLAVGLGNLRVGLQLGAVGFQAGDLLGGGPDLPAAIVFRLHGPAVGLAAACDQVVALQPPLDEGAVFVHRPPLFEAFGGGDLGQAQAHGAGRAPVGADQPVEVALVHRPVEAVLGQERRFLLGGDLDAQHVAGQIAGRGRRDGIDRHRDQEDS